MYFYKYVQIVVGKRISVLNRKRPRKIKQLECRLGRRVTLDELSIGRIGMVQRYQIMEQIKNESFFSFIVYWFNIEYSPIKEYRLL